MQTIQEVAALERQIKDQLRLIDEFRKHNRDHITLVRSGIKGSRKAWDERMLQTLDRAETALNRSQAALQQASDALIRVQAI
ncbi:MAG: hypothetical protein WBO89_12890 [Propionicimonas sp.]